MSGYARSQLSIRDLRVILAARKFKVGEYSVVDYLTLFTCKYPSGLLSAGGQQCHRSILNVTKVFDKCAGLVCFWLTLALLSVRFAHSL